MCAAAAWIEDSPGLLAAVHVLGRAGIPMEGQRDGADHCRCVPRLAHGCRDRLSNQQSSLGPLASFSHVGRSGRDWASGGQDSCRETATGVFARTGPDSTFARCAARARRQSICFDAGRRVRSPCAGWAFRPLHRAPDSEGVAYPFRELDAAGVTCLRRPIGSATPLAPIPLTTA